MEDIFNDPEFAKFGDGVRDLDEDIGRLVYTLFNKKLLETTWSCSGHIGRSTESGHSSRPETHHVYHEGLLFFNVPDNNKSKSFLEVAKDFVSKTQFALYNQPSGTQFANYHQIILDMNDLIDYKPDMDKTAWDYKFFKEVPIAAAVVRYEQFKKFWIDLDDIAKRF